MTKISGLLELFKLNFMINVQSTSQRTDLHSFLKSVIMLATCIVHVCLWSCVCVVLKNCTDQCVNQHEVMFMYSL